MLRPCAKDDSNQRSDISRYAPAGRSVWATSTYAGCPVPLGAWSHRAWPGLPRRPCKGGGGVGQSEGHPGGYETPEIPAHQLILSTLGCINRIKPSPRRKAGVDAGAGGALWPSMRWALTSGSPWCGPRTHMPEDMTVVTVSL